MQPILHAGTVYTELLGITQPKWHYRIDLKRHYSMAKFVTNRHLSNNLIHTETTTTNHKISERRLLTKTRRGNGENLAYVGMYMSV